MESGMQRKFKPAEVGYYGKGIPDPEAMQKLQTAFAAHLIKTGGLSASVLEKFRKMQEIAGRALAQPVDELALVESMNLAKELLPLMHFRVDDVDWDLS